MNRNEQIELYEFNPLNGCANFHALPEIVENAVSEGRFEDARAYWNNLLNYGDLSRYEFPIVFRQSKTFGSKIHEINPSDGVCYPIVSDRVISILENNGITGWKTYPIILYDKHGNRLDGYNGFYVDVMQGMGLDFEPPQDRCDKTTEDWKWIVTKRGWLDITNWDGRDFTRAERATIVTERVVNLFKKEKVTGISFIKYSKEYDIICSK